MPARQPQPADPVEILVEAPAREALSVWDCACDAWSSYFTDLAAAAGPAAVLEANARLMMDGLDLYGRAAGALLASGGLRAPLLNDA